MTHVFKRRSACFVPGRRALGAFVGLCISITGHVAPAAPAPRVAPPIISFESQVGEPSIAESALLQRLRDELQAQGIMAWPSAIIAVADGRAGRPGIEDPGMTAVEIRRLVDAGHGAFTAADFETAIPMLKKAIDLIRRNPALLALDTGNADMIFRAYISLALSQDRHLLAAQGATHLNQGNRPLLPEAAATVAELSRMYPSFRFVQSEYGSNAESQCRQVLKQVVAGPRGQLIVNVRGEAPMVFVDGQMRGLGSVRVADLIAGMHHVFIRTSGSGRRYELEVKANAEVKLEVDPEIDTALWIGEERVAFRLSSEDQRGKEGPYAIDVVERWLGGELVVVVGPRKVDGRSGIVATLYQAKGVPARPPAFIATEDADSSSIRELVQFLLKGTATSRVRVLSAGSNGQLSAMSALAPGRLVLLSEGVSGIGSLAFIGAAAVYIASAPDDFTQPTYDDKRTPAVHVMVYSSAVVGTGAALWLRQTRSSSVLTSTVIGIGVTGFLAGGALYLTDEDDVPVDPGRYVRKYYRDSAPSGVVIGVTGLAMTGVGLWLLHREGSTSAPASVQPPLPAIPTISISSSRVVLGINGTF